MNFKKIIFSFLIISVIVNNCLSQEISYNEAKKVAQSKIIESEKADFSISEKNIENIDLPFFVFELNPYGYVVVSKNYNLPPVIAYSYESNFYDNNLQNNTLEEILTADINTRTKNLLFIPENMIEDRNNQWNYYLNENIEKNSDRYFEQWPPEGTTSTGGWLETKWTQTGTYNKYCPMDTVTDTRSIAGCPAVAMGMIVDYYKTLNSTVFSDVDDYYHNYAGRKYYIDDDFEVIDFLSFDSINSIFDSIENKYENFIEISKDEQAALIFACGVACTQVYTSSASGTFGVGQAYDAFLRFGFENSILMDENDLGIYDSLSNNMKEARPAHLALVNDGWTVGHNVVVDGYNTDNYYHVNFGWGGSYNGWYLLPDEMPYSLTVIEGLIVNIAYPRVPPVNIVEQNAENILVFPNPANNYIYLHSDIAENSYIKITDINGNVLIKEIYINETSKIDISNLEPGVYLIQIIANNKSEFAKFLKI